MPVIIQATGGAEKGSVAGILTSTCCKLPQVVQQLFYKFNFERMDKCFLEKVMESKCEHRKQPKDVVPGIRTLLKIIFLIIVVP